MTLSSEISLVYVQVESAAKERVVLTQVDLTDFTQTRRNGPKVLNIFQV